MGLCGHGVPFNPFAGTVIPSPAPLVVRVTDRLAEIPKRGSLEWLATATDADRFLAYAEELENTIAGGGVFFAPRDVAGFAAALRRAAGVSAGAAASSATPDVLASPSSIGETTRDDPRFAQGSGATRAGTSPETPALRCDKTAHYTAPYADWCDCGRLPTPDWCVRTFHRVNPGARDTVVSVPSLYLWDFAKAVIRAIGTSGEVPADGATKESQPAPSVVPAVTEAAWIDATRAHMAIGNAMAPSHPRYNDWVKVGSFLNSVASRRSPREGADAGRTEDELAALCDLCGNMPWGFSRELRRADGVQVVFFACEPCVRAYDKKILTTGLPSQGRSE